MAAHADAAYSKTVIAQAVHVIHHCIDKTLVRSAAIGGGICRLALAGAVHNQHRKTAIEEYIGKTEHFFLVGIRTAGKQHHAALRIRKFKRRQGICH